jgi:murein DD-endopeptidase MepM/ murein hydrolase activator NlpD
LLALPASVAALLLGGTQHFARLASVPVALDPLGPLPTFARKTGPTVERQLQRGETLSQALSAAGLSPLEVHAAAAEVSRFVDPRRLRAGDVYRATYAAAAVPALPEVESLELRLAQRGEVRLTRNPQTPADGSPWLASFRAVERSTRSRFVAGALEENLEQGVRAAGADPALAYAMADVLAWDLDFNRDLRRGDTFRVAFEEELIDGSYAGVGKIAALVYENEGRRHEAYRFGDRGYFDAEGRPLQKMFLRSPLKFSRVTSGFSARRFHPVLKTYRPHWGVDFGAPTGTPVHATAHGTVTSAGWDGGGGKVVKVRHSNGYVSCYLHLSRFAAGIKAGRRVSQGEVIGYVGATGLATAAHLDYRVQLNGRWINPLKISNSRAEPLVAADLARFREWAATARAALDGGRPLAPATDPVAGGDTLVAQSREAPSGAAPPADVVRR